MINQSIRAGEFTDKRKTEIIERGRICPLCGNNKEKEVKTPLVHEEIVLRNDPVNVSIAELKGIGLRLALKNQVLRVETIKDDEVLEFVDFNLKSRKPKSNDDGTKA